NGILWAPQFLFRSLPPLGVPFGYRISPLLRPACTHPVFPAVYTDRDDRGPRGYGRPSGASRAGAPIVDRGVKDGRGLYRHPLLARVEVAGDLAGFLVHSPPNFRSTGPLPSILRKLHTVRPSSS